MKMEDGRPAPQRGSRPPEATAQGRPPSIQLLQPFDRPQNGGERIGLPSWLRRLFRESRLIQLTHTGLTVDRQEIAGLRAQFSEVHCVQLPQLLAPSLLRFVQHRLEQGRWETKIYPDVGEEYSLDDQPALNLLHFVANLPDFRNLLEEITGCTPLRGFEGRIYRMTAAAGHYDHWHDDTIGPRLVGMSLNLSPRPFRGGLFQLREYESERMLAQIANTGPGSALVFRIAERLQHRISDMEGDEPKTAFAGWFRPDLPDFFEGLRSRALTATQSKPR